MMEKMLIRAGILCTYLFLFSYAFSQDSKTDKRKSAFTNSSSQIFNEQALVEENDFDLSTNNDLLVLRVQICKENFFIRYRPVKANTHGKQQKISVLSLEKVNTSLFRVNGVVQYDFLYRSYIDTPFAQHDFRQHVLQTTLNVAVKDKTPLRLNFSTQRNNSPYFTNLTNVNLAFDSYAYLKNAKQELLHNARQVYFDDLKLKAVEAALLMETRRFSELQFHLNSPDLLQQVIAERERVYRELRSKEPLSSKLDSAFHIGDQKQPGVAVPGLPAEVASTLDSSKENNEIGANLDRQKRQIDTLRQRVFVLENQLDSIYRNAQTGFAAVQRRIYNAKSYRELKTISDETGLPTSKSNKWERFLSGMREIGVGRSIVSASELTAWNVGLTGLHLERNAEKYSALSVGKIDYGFRNLWSKNGTEKAQNFLMVRYGYGDKDSKALIFSVFAGQKQNYGSTIADTIRNHVNVLGYSVEAILKKSDKAAIGLELAKTTKSVSGRFADNNNLKSLSAFGDMSNLGINLKVLTTLRPTATRLSGFYRKTGRDFQSFSLFTYHTDQTAWQMRVDQSLFKNKVDVVAMLRRNDFVNPFTEKTFQTNTVFTTFQIHVRFPKYPVVSVGYYPGSQIYLINKERLRENVYRIVNGSVVYSYKAADMHMVSAFTWNQYSSKATDSGFLAYQGYNCLASHTLLLNSVQLQGAYQYTNQEKIKYATWEGNADFTIHKAIRMGGGGKYNVLDNGETYWGGRCLIAIDVRTLGRLQCQYEKSYWPTITASLVPIEIGRLSWFKNF